MDARCRPGSGRQHDGVLYMHVEAGSGLKSRVDKECEVEWKQEKVAEDGDDWKNVEQLSDMFSLMEGEHELGADFGVFIEDEDAINVEEISDIFSALEEANQSSKELEIVLPAEPRAESSDVEDARVVDEFSDMFSELESAEDSATAVDAEDAQNVDAMADLFTNLEEQDAVDSADAKNVDAMSELFSELENDEAAADTVSDQDWIDALQVDSVSNLFSKLEKAAEPARAPIVSLPKPAAPKVDSRIFVPKFSVQIEGRAAPCLGSSLLSSSSALLSGPPRSVSRHCPPPPTAVLIQSATQSKGKRKAQSSKALDPSISDTRRACAAKRHRVKGRFVAEKQSFVAITSLQHS